jgi:hypothetical protein
MKIIESNCVTGEVTERDMTPEEVEQILASVPVETPTEPA